MGTGRRTADIRSRRQEELRRMGITHDRASAFVFEKDGTHTIQAQKICRCMRRIFPKKGLMGYCNWQTFEQPDTVWMIHVMGKLYCGTDGLLQLDTDALHRGSANENMQAVYFGIRHHEEALQALRIVKKAFPKAICGVAVLHITNEDVRKAWGTGKVGV